MQLFGEKKIKIGQALKGQKLLKISEQVLFLQLPPTADPISNCVSSN